MKIIDISVMIDKSLTLWPNSSGFSFKHLSKIGKKNSINETHIQMNAHAGTHIDAPLHFVPKGSAIHEAPLSVFIGPVTVAYIPKAKAITAEVLEKLNLPKDIKRILFKTSNSDLWKRKVKKFQTDYVGVTSDGASWLVKRGVKLVGIDYLSIAKMSEAVNVHQIILGNGVYILEALNLSKVKSGNYELVCFPLNINNIEASPTRAVLLRA